MVELAPGRPRKLGAEGEINAALPEVQLGLLWEPEGDASSDLTMRNLRMEVNLP
jgi:hypothetical protein